MAVQFRFNYQKWFPCNFFPWYSAIIQQTDYEHFQAYQVEIVILIWHQILLTNLNRSVWQQEERIDHQILGDKGV